MPRQPIGTVLVTGGTGFVGRRLVARLGDLGVKTRCLVRRHHPADVFGDGHVDICVGDLTDAESVHAAMEGVEAVFHLAAVVGDWGSPDEFRRVNVGGTRNVFDAALAQDARVVLASSIIVYGDALRTAVCDERTDHGRTFAAYGMTKQQQERLALAYVERGLHVAILRLGNVYGPDSRVWVDTPAEYLASGLPSLVAGGRGNACLLHVDNAVSAIVAAWQTDCIPGRAYNVADGSVVTWAQYFGDLARLVGAPSPRSMPLAVARTLAMAMESAWKILGRTDRPPLTREALAIVTSHAPLPIDRARNELSYRPAVSYEEGLRSVAGYLDGARR